MSKSNSEAAAAGVKAFYRSKATEIGAIGGTDGTGYALLIADMIGSIIDGKFGISAGTGIAGGLNIFAGLITPGCTPAIPNPMFIANGHDEPVWSALTELYLGDRAWKGMGATALSLIGMGASVGTGGVNVVDVAMHGNASYSTLWHLKHLGLMAHSYRQTVTISDWLKVVVAMKTLKLTIRGGQAAFAFVPGASLPVGVAAAAMKAGIKMSATNTCLMTAMAIHWRAYREQVIGASLGGGGKAEGPATRIFVEVLKRRGLGRFYGHYDPLGMIREPAGWQVLGDKILQI
ncbi:MULTISPECIES: hypothetical protein [Roseomonadaceae]|uniref:Uncharacterized protein n=1 Tax=Falsiroseomonas oleicola TaxID=2801474 RepID=A0ABS6H878_9PROT|nr:hypothetical protein [Roseomonas oleicola]MBU8544906.1 hypothetical protein [Roseomonas oleicola]